MHTIVQTVSQCGPAAAVPLGDVIYSSPGAAVGHVANICENSSNKDSTRVACDRANRNRKHKIIHPIPQWFPNAAIPFGNMVHKRAACARSHAACVSEKTACIEVSSINC